MVQGLLSFVVVGRGWLADLASLRWARPGGLDLAVPASMVLVVGYAVPQLGRDVAGAPFWLAWLIATAGILLLLRASGWMARGAMSTTTATPIAGAGSARTSPAGHGFALRRLTTLQLALVVEIAVVWVLYDILLWQPASHLYDLNVYLGASERWMNGGQAYVTTVLTTWPSSARADFFLYPPPLLPFFALLSQLPSAPVAAAWTAFQLACWYRAFRILGVAPSLSLLLLAFPPVMIGLESGNVAGLTFLLFVAAVRTGGALVVDGIFKVQSSIPVLWLLREGRWRGLLAGTAAASAIVLVTLPLVGIDAWRAWWAGLGYRASSQAVADALYGYSYAKELSAPAYVAACGALTVVALAFRGRRGLAALGLASLFASPALWPHGFAFALPAVLMLESGTAVWLVLGAGAFGSNMWLLFVGGWLAVMAARRFPAGRLHPLAGTDGPWPRPIGLPASERATPLPPERATPPPS
ncbi:MAG TPA: glycosyltransferase family 87 protein [Candidatus Limnocylindrales bacterium]